MKPKSKLTPSMSVAEFDSGYWYATALKAFAKAIGIPSAGKCARTSSSKRSNTSSQPARQ